MSDEQQPEMLPNERSDAYMKRTGYHPPGWTVDQSRAFDAKVWERQRAGDRRWLSRYGLLDTE
ncbi:hypothetical protein [Streptosporangium sandarakinum]|uniref:hypothetical protein n=1 Tax=Streptosporangium sandarakinum TaxID=1260955 RepID=UPI003788B4C2